jgi:hypothetical protein
MARSILHAFMLSWLLSAIFGQVVGPRELKAQQVRALETFASALTVGQVTVDGLEVYERPDEGSYVTGELTHEDRVRVRQTVTGGWLAIDPPSGTLCWIEQAAINPIAANDEQSGRVADPARARQSESQRASVAAIRAIIRFGHEGARMPGPPCGELNRGTIVERLDRSPLEVGRGSSKRVWIAIVPPPALACFIRSDGVRNVELPPSAPAAHSQPGYVPARYARSNPNDSGLEHLPATYAAAIKAVDDTHRSMRLSVPIVQWQTESVRSRYQSILKSAGNDPAVEEAIRRRLASLSRDEQAAEAARTIESVLAESHRHDRDVAALKRRLAAASQTHTRAYSAVGYIQPSAEEASGRKLYLLIGKDGSTIAYLDIPPGLDIAPHLAHRVGVRGDPHFNEDLGSRLITVRDVETMDSRR